MRIQEIVEKYLKDNGYDGLTCSGVCGCEVGDLFPCGEPENCEAGYKVPCPGPADCPADGDCPFHISTKKRDRIKG